MKISALLSQDADDTPAVIESHSVNGSSVHKIFPNSVKTLDQTSNVIHHPFLFDRLVQILSPRQRHIFEAVQTECMQETGEHVAVVQADNQYFLLGMQIARLLKKETSNLYRSLKRANIALRKVSLDQVCWVTSGRLRQVKKIHSVILIPVADALDHFSSGNFSLKPLSCHFSVGLSSPSLRNSNNDEKSSSTRKHASQYNRGCFTLFQTF